MAKKTSSLSIIDDGIAVDGSIEFTGELLIRGSLTGKVTGDTVTIAEEGTVKADMQIKRMTVGGLFEGDVQAAEELVVLPNGECRGKVVCKQLVVQEDQSILASGPNRARVLASASGASPIPWFASAARSSRRG